MYKAIEERLCDYSEMADVSLNKYLPEVMCLQKDVLDTARQAVNGTEGRIRAALVLEFCRVCGEEPETALPMACAAEMVYAGLKLHERFYSTGADINMLFAGDALVLKSAEVVAKAAVDGRFSDDAALKIIEMLCDKAGVFGVSGGMSLDNDDKIPAGVILEKYRMRNGALFEFCCRAGCIAAGAGISKQVSAGAFGQRLGLAKAIMEDIADRAGYTVSVGADTARLDVKRLFDEANEALSDFEDNGFLAELAKMLISSEETGG